MLKNDKFYTFLLSHTTKSKIYIRRFEISRNFVHTGIAGLIVTFGIASFGVFGVLKNNVLAQSEVENNETVATAALTKTQAGPIDYSRPGYADNFSVNSGGPELDDQMDNGADAADTSTIEGRIQKILATSDPASLPSVWAHMGKINNEFGFRRNPFGGRSYEFHAGMDIDGEKGDPVIAPGSGVVVKAGWQGGYGNMIEIDHGNGISTRFGHLSKIDIEPGDTVARGQLIGQVGSTGRSTGPHLHYEVRLNDKSINPRWFLPSQGPETRN